MGILHLKKKMASLGQTTATTHQNQPQMGKDFDGQEAASLCSRLRGAAELPGEERDDLAVGLGPRPIAERQREGGTQRCPSLHSDPPLCHSLQESLTSKKALL